MRKQPALSLVSNRVDCAQNMEYPHRGCPPSPDEVHDDGGVQKIKDAMTMLTMTGSGGGIPIELSIPSAAKENVRPNSSGKAKKWRNKKANHDHPRSEADGHDVGSSTEATTTTTASTAVESATINGKTPQMKNTKPVVVDISSSNQPQMKKPAARLILPSMDFQVAVDAGSGAAIGIPPTSDNEALRSNGCDVDDCEQEKKARTKKNSRKKRNNKKPQAAKKGDASGGGMDFSTNAGGASVLSLLGHYPHVMTSAFDVYDGCTPHPSNQMAMAGGGDGYQHVQYDPSNYPSGGTTLPTAYADHHAYTYGMHYPYAATPANGMYPGAAIMMPGEYYAPAMMNGQTTYYNQPNAGTNENAPYYPHACHSPYMCETSDATSSARGKSPLNINAHEFLPVPAHDPKKGNSEA